MKPEDRRRLKQHIDMIVNHNAPSVTFCPNCECDRETILYSEVRECAVCCEEFEVVCGIKPSNSDASMTQDVLTDVKTWQSFEELKPDIAKRYEELLNMRNTETEQFNDGFDDARAGKLETDHPHYDFDTDNWRLGYAWGMFEPMKEENNKLRAELAALREREQLGEFIKEDK